MQCTFLLLLLILAEIVCCSSKSMWGSRRKRDEIESFAKPKVDFKLESKRRKPVIQDLEFKSPPKNNDQISGYKELIESYLTIVEELLNSGEFEKLVNTQSLRSLIGQVPGLSDNEELSQLLNSPEMNNPNKLKRTIREGINMLRLYSDDIVSTLSDPMKLSEIMDQLPPETVHILDALKTGDTTILQTFIEQLPGIEEAQKSMLINIVNGDSSALTADIQKALQDPDQVEAARQEFLRADPDMLLAMGISGDVISDPALFAAHMAHSVEAMTEMLEKGNSAFDEPAPSSSSTADAEQQLAKLRKKFSMLNRAA